MKEYTENRTDGIWLSREELTDLMESLTKEAREEEDDVKRAFAYGKAVMVKDLLCRIKNSEPKNEHKPLKFIGSEDDDLILYNNETQKEIRVGCNGLFALGVASHNPSNSVWYEKPNFFEDINEFNSMF